MSEIGIIILLFISIGILIGTSFLTGWLLSKKRKAVRQKSPEVNSKTPFRAFVIGFYIAAFFLILPCWFNQSPGPSSFFLTLHKLFRLSVLNEEFPLRIQNEASLSIVQSISNPFLSKLFYSYSSLIFLIAPILATGFILSFFKGFFAIVKYYFMKPLWRDIVVFSELNEQSLELACNLIDQKECVQNGEQGRSKKKKLVLVFTGVSEKTDPTLLNQAENLGAICSSRDVTLFGMKRHVKNITRKIYLISDNEDENLRKGLFLINAFKQIPNLNTSNTKIFIFSTAMESNLLLDNTDLGGLFVRRVNITRNMAYMFFNENNVFTHFYEVEGVKELNVAILGFGLFGQEMMKAFCWMGQMPGYTVNVFVFDKRKDVKRKMEAKTPTLVKFASLSAGPRYSIQFFEGKDVNCSDFFDAIREVNETHPLTHVFVTLGDDKANVETAVRLRSCLSKQFMQKEKEVALKDHFTQIYASVYDNERYATIKNGLKGMPNQVKSLLNKNNTAQTDYEISIIGNLESVFSPEYVELVTLEEQGKKQHTKWAKTTSDILYYEKTFNQFEYNRASSIAKMLYEKFRADIIKEFYPNMTEEEKNENEHDRWWAYMATIGYDYVNEDLRDDVAMVHYDMIPYGKLDKEEQKKDASAFDSKDGDSKESK